MSEINDLRKSVYQAQRRAASKKKRLYDENRAIVDGTAYDPVKPGKWVAHANSSALKAQLKRLNSFNSRKTQFYGDAENKPIKGETWNHLKTEVNRFNKIRSEYYNSISDIKMPSGVTLDKASQLRTGKYVNYIDDFRVDKTVNHRAFYGENNIKKEIKRYKAFNRRGVEGLIKSSRDNFLSIVIAEGANAPEWTNRAAELNDNQFFALWSGTDFKKLVGSNYTMMKEGLTRHNADIVKENNDSITELLDWAESPRVAKRLNAKESKKG